MRHLRSGASSDRDGRRARRRLTGTFLAIVGAGAMLVACSDDGGGDDLAAFCATSADTGALAQRFATLDPRDVPTALATFTDALDAERRLADLAPEAIAADVEVLVEFLEDLVAGLDATDPEAPTPAIYEDLAPRSEAVTAASGRIEGFVEANCPSSATPTSGATEPETETSTVDGG